jgi:hypothetical protein
MSADVMKTHPRDGISGWQALAVIVVSVAMMAVLFFLAPP